MLSQNERQLLRSQQRCKEVSNAWHSGGMQGEVGAMIAYEIRVKGHLDQRWSAWFDGMTITNVENGDTIITGSLLDQAALHSLLVKVYNLNLTLISVSRIETDATR